MQAYLDNSATTKCAPEVVDVCVKVMSEDYGNPSSKHMKGVEAENYIKEAKETTSGAHFVVAELSRYACIIIPPYCT